MNFETYDLRDYTQKEIDSIKKLIPDDIWDKQEAVLLLLDLANIYLNTQKY